LSIAFKALIEYIFMRMLYLTFRSLLLQSDICGHST